MATAVIYANPKVMNDIITKLRLVQYPESVVPPSPEEFEKLRLKMLEESKKREEK